MTQAEALKTTHAAPEKAIDNQLKNIRTEEIAKNRTIIKHIASAIHLYWETVYCSTWSQR